MGVPGHPLAEGVICTVTIPGVVPGLVSVHAGIGLAVPEAAKPVIPPVAVAVQE